MRIGIAGPVELMSLKEHLPGATPEQLALGLGGTAVNILIDGFLKLGHTVTVFTLDRGVNSKLVINGGNLKIIVGHVRSNWKRQMLDFQRYESKQILEFILSEKDNLDVVNAHWSYEYAIGTIKSGVPHVITFRDDAPSILKLSKHPFRLMRLLMDKWVRKNGRSFSFNSDYLQHLIKVNGLVIPNPIKDDEITSSKCYPDHGVRIKICFVGNGWSYRKNPDTAIDALALVKEQYPNVEFHFIGSGFEPGNARCLQIIGRRFNESFVFRGAMPHASLLKELEHFHIMLHTAREESFGNNLVEAMAKGIPVVAGKNAGAVPWVLDNGFAGCLTDVESPETVAKDIIRLLTDKVYYEQLSKNGIENLRKRFTQSSVCTAYVEAFRMSVKMSKSVYSS